MKARMKKNLIVRYQLCPELNYKDTNCKYCNELIALRKIYGWGGYFDTKLFLKSIEGKVVDLIFTGGDAFEKNDNNHWLPSDLWELI